VPSNKHWRDAMNERNQDWINSRDKPREIVTKASSKAYRDNWDRIFGGGTGGDKQNATSNTEKPTE
jgi:hypothetical protein